MVVLRQRPMVLYIDALKTGGAERICLRWASWLYQSGRSVKVLTRHGPKRDFYPMPEGIERAVEPLEPSWLRRLGWFGFPLRLWRLRRLLISLDPVVVIGVTTLPAIKLLLASQGCPWGVVITERNYPPVKSPARPWRWLRRLTYPWAQAHLVQTRRTADWLVATHAVPQRRIHLVPNPVIWPLLPFEPKLNPAAFLPPDCQVLLAVGTKPYQKGFDRLLDAFLLIAPLHPDWHLVILGLDSSPGHHQQAVSRLLARRQDEVLLRERLHCPGPVGNVADWYAVADLFVLSSRYEGFPNVLLEAMASGCACLAYACPTGPDEIIHHGKDGWLLSAEASVDDLAGGLLRLMEDPVLRRRLGRNARAVITRFSEQNICRRFLASLAPSKSE